MGRQKKGKGGQVAEHDEGKRTSARQKETEAGREEGKEVLDSPPLGLISFCILCCEPAVWHEHAPPGNSNAPKNQSDKDRKDRWLGKHDAHSK